MAAGIISSRNLANFSRFLTSGTKINTCRSINTNNNNSCRWQIVGAACVTRPPVVCPPMNPIEQQYSGMLATMEKELSLKSDHEIRVEKDKIYKKLLMSGEVDDAADLDRTSTQTVAEFEDTCTQELNDFNATLLPMHDRSETNDVRKRLHRCLERSLVLVVKHKLIDVQEWTLPHTPWTPGETLRQTCERVVGDVCGESLKVKFLGNAPCGFYKYKYPKTIRKDGYIGAKVFFYKCVVLGNKQEEVEFGADIDDHQWLTHDELKHTLKQSYAKSISQFLISDR
ncbi:hypothetical protein Pcinc_028912 [Petrolisthes cinctipes]|uniref:Large ribosomal subunit protein mL46 n=1 Tax=Petrolisthes cinctipes TaxID=88211 RepID=A0AAE1F277_PETCI|nr:hypothetical protein Pcinc_028912 [Petrolisthes cinctipes]